MIDTARRYIEAGLCALPASRADKRPIRQVGKWKPYRTRKPTEAELTAWFANNPDALCILCGQASGNLEAMDFDAAGELFDAWWAKLPEGLRAKLVIERTRSGGWHVIYRCLVAVCGNLKLAQRMTEDGVVTLIETRGEGGLIICAPTEGYEVTQGDLCDLPVLTEQERDILLQAAWELNEYVPPVVDGPSNARTSPQSAHVGHVSRPVVGAATDRPGDDFNTRGDVRAVLETHGWCRVSGGENAHWRRPGKSSGTSATLKQCPTGLVFYVFSSNAAPFEANQAYSPFAVYAYLEHGGDFAAATRALAEQGYGSAESSDNREVNICGIVTGGRDDDDDGADDDPFPDPGPIPERLFEVPGFIGEVMAFSLGTAPYPNVGLSFCGAIALQSFLCGRKVRDASDLRTNIYLLALAGAGTGKDHPRKINNRILFTIDQTRGLGDKFSSGEGIEDQLAKCPNTLYQNDEVDGMLQAIKAGKEHHHKSMMTTLLSMYSYANSVYPIRHKAGKDSGGSIDQPHITLYGTATPKSYYESLSERMLTNGFFARMVVVDVADRSDGQDGAIIDDLPAAVVETAKWWNENQPYAEPGNLRGEHPKTAIVPYTDDARELMNGFRALCDGEYRKAPREDEVTRTVWGRGNENARKLALLYACSKNHVEPVVDLDAAEWARAFSEHQIRRMLHLSNEYVARNEFDAMCKEMLRVLRQWRDGHGEQWMPFWRISKRLKWPPRVHDDVRQTLINSHEIEYRELATGGRPTRQYRLRAQKQAQEVAQQVKKSAGEPAK